MDIETVDAEEGFEAVETAVQPTDTGLQPTDTGLQPTDTGLQPTDTGLQSPDTDFQGDEPPQAYGGAGSCYIEFGEGLVGRADVVFPPGGPPTGTFAEP